MDGARGAKRQRKVVEWLNDKRLEGWKFKALEDSVGCLCMIGQAENAWSCAGLLYVTRPVRPYIKVRRVGEVLEGLDYERWRRGDLQGCDL